MDKRGPEFLKKVFEKFVADHAKDGLVERAVRSLAAGGQAAVERGLKEFPKPFVQALAGDLYKTLSGQDVADGVSMTIRSFDEQEAKKFLDGLVAKVAEDEFALNIAKSVKKALANNSADDIENKLMDALSGRGGGEMRMAMFIFASLKPQLEELRDAPVEDIAERIKDIAATVPTDALAEQVAAVTSEMSPERVSRFTQGQVKKLPTAGAVADIVHGVGKVAKDKLGEIAATPDLNTARAKLDEFKAEARKVVGDVVSNDNAEKRKPKTGGSFDL